MRKKAVLGTLLASASLVLGACGGGGGDSATHTLKFASYNVPDAAEARAQKEWAERIEEETDGKVKIEFFWQEALLPAAETLQGVADGRADIGWVATGYYPAELPLSNIAGVPFVSTDPAASAQAMTELMETSDDLAKEWESQGVKVLTWSPVSANIIASKEPIDSMDDLKGAKVRGYGYVSEALKTAGANAIGLSQPEVYEALQRGVLDATSGAALNIAVDRKFHEVAPHFTGLGFGSYATTADVISLEKWNSLPSDVQEAIEKVNAEHPEIYAKFLRAEEDQACKDLLAADGTASVLDSSETEAWQAETGPKIQKVWAADVRKANADAEPDAFFDEYAAAVGAYEEANTDYREPVVRCADAQ